jgi:hypothetical protein
MVDVRHYGRCSLSASSALEAVVVARDHLDALTGVTIRVAVSGRRQLDILAAGRAASLPRIYSRPGKPTKAHSMQPDRRSHGDLVLTVANATDVIDHMVLARHHRSSIPTTQDQRLPLNVNGSSSRRAAKTLLWSTSMLSFSHDTICR